MKLVLYKENDEIKHIFEGLEDLSVKDNSVYWSDGSMEDIKINFIVLDDADTFNAQIGDTIDSQTKSLDKASENIFVDVKKEVEDIKKENENLKAKIEKLDGGNPVNLM